MPNSASDASVAPPLAIVNARVWTGIPARPWADAVLVRDGRVLAVGSSAELRKRAGTSALIVDAGRRLLLHSAPGATIVSAAAADLTLVDDLVSLEPPPELDERSIVLVVSSGRLVHDRISLTP
jgi:predicted amidohydrolase YtcJ